MKHLEPNKKVNDMKKEKLISIMIVSLLILSTLMIVYTPKVNATPDSVMHTATVSPQVTTVPQVTYVFNVTNISNETAKIDTVNITFPTSFTLIGVAPPTGWTNDTGWPTISFTNSSASGALDVNASALFNVTVLWPAVPPTTATLKVNCSAAGMQSINNPVSLAVSFNPQFSATITPTHVKGNTSYIFNITAVNAASSVGLGTINITYPSGWTFNAIVNYGGSRTWSTVHDSNAKTFKLTGPNLLIGEYIWIQVNMTTPATSSDPAYWNSTAWDISAQLLGTCNLPVVVDAQPPTVTITKPELSIFYTVGSGNRIWINGTVSDDLNITKYGVEVVINDTARFERVAFTKGADDFNYTFSFANKTAIPDGPLAVKITATDAAGNAGPAERSTTIDNTAPRIVWVKVLDQYGNELPYVSGVYWMGAGTTGIRVNASFYNTATISGYIYLNTTQYTFTNETATPTPPTLPFDVTGSDYVILKITLIDSAQPTPNNFTQTWEIKRDKVIPSTPTFTVQPICGGAIIRALNATDNVGVLSYRVYINGTSTDVSLTSLTAATLTPIGDHRTFSGVLVLNLASYAGKVANITIATVDYGANEGNSTSSIISVPVGIWYPIELQPNWNLISLPLVPTNSSINNVLSLLLKEGLLVSVWQYDAETKAWHSYAPGAPPDLTTMVDGKGYFIKVTAYNVLIIQGTEQPAPPATPPVYHVVPGWNLIGYKEIITESVSTYLSGVDYIRVYSFDASTQTYTVLKPSDNMESGLGYWVAVKTEGWIYP